MTWKLKLTDSEVEARVLKLELAGQNDAGGLYRTAYGDLRLHLAK
jgi:hypothetical protein